MRVALLITCLVDLFEPDIGDATVDVLEAAGCEVICPLGQTCCGQPAWNAGFAEDAARVARTTLDRARVGSGRRRGGDRRSGRIVHRDGPRVLAGAVRHGGRRRRRSLGQRAVGARTYELTELLTGPLRGRVPPLHLAGPHPGRVAPLVPPSPRAERG